jgi:hypothetical protein
MTVAAAEPEPDVAARQETFQIPYRAVYTTGQISRYLCVAPRTVAAWFDSGRLRGYRIPPPPATRGKHGGDRRITHAALVEFVRDFMPGVAVAAAGATMLVLSRDRGLVATALSAARRLGITTSVCRDDQEAREAVGAGTRLVLLDLNAADTDEAAVVKSTCPKAILAVVPADDDQKAARAARLRPDYVFGRDATAEVLTRWASNRNL